MFIDLCTAKPEDKHEISKIVEDTGNYYVDVAVMGSVPTLKHKVPMYISGSGCKLMCDILSPFGMDITCVGEKAGSASIIKLCRSIYMKGLAALSIELEEVCNHYGVKDEVYASLAKSMDNDNFMTYTPRLIKGTKLHCVRRLNEVKECLDLISATQTEGYMTEATRKLYETLID